MVLLPSLPSNLFPSHYVFLIMRVVENLRFPVKEMDLLMM